MSALDRYESGALAVPMPAGGRQLGVRVRPIIRLGMGHKHPEKGYPIKDDHFTVRGDERAAAKFTTVYKDTPKAVEILLPSELDVALSIQYRAFKGAQGDEGGTLVAVGETNFALRDYVGGPDVLTVFNQDGTVEQVETLGLDANTKQPLDQAAADLGLELYTTLRAGMPKVLGFGSFFEISTKGKQSTDNLWARLRELYGLFGPRVTFAVKPLLVIRESTARPVVVKDGESKRIKSKIYVLDVVVPESIDEMIDRLQQRNAVLAPAGATAALYGPTAVQTSPPDQPASAPPADTTRTDSQQAAEPGEAGDGVEGSAAPDEDEAVLEGEVVSEDEPEPKLASAATDPGAALVTFGQFEGQTLAEIAQLPDSAEWFAWAMNTPKKVPADLYPQIAAFLEAQGQPS